MWGTGSYSEDNDVLRTEVAASGSNSVVETFSMDIRDITGTSCAIGIEWEKTSVVIPIQMDVARQAEMNIAKAIEEEQENWRVFRNSAQYYMNAGNMEEALVLIDRCLELDGAAGTAIGFVPRSFTDLERMIRPRRRHSMHSNLEKPGPKKKAPSFLMKA